MLYAELLQNNISTKKKKKKDSFIPAESVVLRMIFLPPLVQRHQTIKSTFARLISYYNFFFLHTHIQKGTSKLLGAFSCFTTPLRSLKLGNTQQNRKFFFTLTLAKYIPQCITRDCLHQICLSTLSSFCLLTFKLHVHAETDQKTLKD